MLTFGLIVVKFSKICSKLCNLYWQIIANYDVLIGKDEERQDDMSTSESEGIRQRPTAGYFYENEGPVFKAVRKNDVVQLSIMIFFGFDINSSNEKEVNIGRKNIYYDFIDWRRMAGVVRIICYPPLHLAVAHSKVNVVKYLISKGADVNMTDDNRFSPLSVAAAVQRVDVVKILTDEGAYVNRRDNHGRTPLMMAVGCNGLSVVRELLKAGADPEIPDKKGTTPLLMCLQARKADTNNLKVLQTLIDAGCALDKANKEGKTVLMHAVALGLLDAVDVLVKSGADINLRDRKGQTVMHYVTSLTMAVYLVQHGATSNLPDEIGITPFDRVVKKGHAPLITLFLQLDYKRMPAILDVPRLMQVRQQIPLFDIWLQEEFSSDRNLLWLCRQVIRQSLSPSNTAFILSLPIPWMLRDFLLGKDLELVFKF